MQVIAGTGRFHEIVGKNAERVLEKNVWQLVRDVLAMREQQEIDHSLIELFCSQASIGIENFATVS
jgi:hypothetical protein